MEERDGRGSQASPVALAIIVGAIVLSLADQVPGGLAGPGGFLLGVVATLIAVWFIDRFSRDTSSPSNSGHEAQSHE